VSGQRECSLSLKLCGPFPARQRMTICAWGMGTTGRYDFYMSPIDDPQAFVRVNVDGPIVADNYGNIKFVAANDARPADGTPRLPIPIDRTAIVVFVSASRSRTRDFCGL